MLDQLSDYEPGANKAENVSKEHEDGQCRVEGGALLRQQQKVNVDWQLRQQGEEPVADKLRYLLLHIADETCVKAQRLANAPQNEQNGVENAEPAGRLGGEEAGERWASMMERLREQNYG